MKVKKQITIYLTRKDLKFLLREDTNGIFQEMDDGMYIDVISDLYETEQGQGKL